MFGRKSAEREGAIDVAEFGFLEGAEEFARMWASAGAGQTFIIEPRNLGADPFLFGMAMVDAIRHGAKAWAHAIDIPEDEALARIFEGFDAERASPTDDPIDITSPGEPN